MAPPPARDEPEPNPALHLGSQPAAMSEGSAGSAARAPQMEEHGYDLIDAGEATMESPKNRMYASRRLTPAARGRSVAGEREPSWQGLWQEQLRV